MSNLRSICQPMRREWGRSRLAIEPRGNGLWILGKWPVCLSQEAFFQGRLFSMRSYIVSVGEVIWLLQFAYKEGYPSKDGVGQRPLGFANTRSLY